MSDTSTETETAVPEPTEGAEEAAAAEDGTAAATDEAVQDAFEEPEEQQATQAFANLELDDDGMPSPEDLTDGLRAVMDPEIGYNIVDLGLVYEVSKPEEGHVHILMTLTSMGCPLTEVIHEQCSVILGAMPGVESVDVEFTFSPPWDTSMVADHVADELRAMGMSV